MLMLIRWVVIIHFQILYKMGFICSAVSDLWSKQILLYSILPITTQEVLYSRHGKHAKEALFYTHALPLPGFLLLGHDILRSLESL